MATLHFKSPVYVQRGFGILFHKSPHYIQPGYIQHGDGIGNIFKSLFRFLVPAAKKTFKAVGNVGKQLLSNPAVKDIAKTVKEEVLRTGVNAVANVIAGNSVAEPMQSDIAEAREKIATTIKKIQPGSGKKRSSTTLSDATVKKKLKKLIESEPDIFSD